MNASDTTTPPEWGEGREADPAVQGPPTPTPSPTPAPTPTPTPTSAPIRVTVVEAEACHFCEAARETIARVARDVPLAVTLIPSRSPRGLELVGRHRAAMAPLVLVEDRRVASGRLSERALRASISDVRAERARS